ncbi:hypothetical protein BJ170DRAFT_265966 [Xylariales sp. AK1849]|nr:hypothetical protein BJ170DRAFT_265966 [Xylariales sp. AK1849]
MFVATHVSRETLLLGLLFPSLVSSQYLGGSQIEAPGNFSAACNATYSEIVACNMTLYQVALGELYPTTSQLAYICTDNCLSGLEALRASQLSACSSSDVIFMDGVIFPPTYTTDLLMFTYNYTCLVDPTTGHYCSPSFFEWNNGTNATSADLCSNCNLLTQQVQLDSFFGWDDDIAQAYSSLTASCGVSSYPVTSPAAYSSETTGTSTTTAAATTTSAAYACTSTYTIQIDDTCESISISQQVATFYLMQANNLAGYCSDFPEAGSTLCIPQGCGIYTVQANDTCYDIVQTYNGSLSVTQMVSWNPNINRGCTNLDQLEGYQICVSYPGIPHVATTATTSATVTSLAAVPTNLAPNTTTDCAKYYTVVDGDTCAAISLANGISLSDFYFLNPAVNSTCGNLWLNYAYCIEAVGKIVTYSGYGGTTVTADPCMSISAPSSCFVTTYPTTTVKPWPAVGSSYATSTAIYPNATLTTDLPLAPGSLDNNTCTKYTQYFPSGTNGTNYNTCGYVAHIYDITIANLLVWNPSLTYDSSNPTACVLVAGYKYCIRSGSASATRTTSAPTPTSTSNTSPDGTCGEAYYNYTCAGSQFGDCCSSYGYCGSASDYCDVSAGCLPAFGTCSETSTTTSTAATATPTGLTVSTNGGCGTDYEDMTCAGSGFGDCCSAYGYCGSSSEYCAVSNGCQSTYGTCS